MSIKEVMEYTGFGRHWVLSKKEDIGYFQDGSKDMRFYKENIDAYFRAHHIQRKSDDNSRFNIKIKK